MITTKDTAQRSEVGSSIILPKSLRANSEPQLTGKTGHQLTRFLLALSQIVQFCTPVLGVERNVNMLVSKDGEIVQCGSGKGHWPFRDWVEATGCCGTLPCQSSSTISKLRLRYRDTHDMNNRSRSGRPRITTDGVDRSTLRNRRITACSLQMRYLGCHGRRMSYRPLGTGYMLPSWNPGKLSRSLS